ncbi:unnamed protein product [Heterobilharzia americana]|nr:unnamed protein product [Heterobilharzia americana]
MAQVPDTSDNPSCRTRIRFAIEEGCKIPQEHQSLRAAWPALPVVSQPRLTRHGKISVVTTIAAKVEHSISTVG